MNDGIEGIGLRQASCAKRSAVRDVQATVTGLYLCPSRMLGYMLKRAICTCVVLTVVESYAEQGRYCHETKGGKLQVHHPCRGCNLTVACAQVTSHLAQQTRKLDDNGNIVAGFH
jgi:hypothetical protein